MSGEPTYTRAGRWALLLGLIVVCLIAGLALAFGGYVGGRGLATAPGDPGQSLAMWVGAGLALGAPVAALHRLGFPVSTRASLTCAAIVAAVVAAGGFLLSR